MISLVAQNGKMLGQMTLAEAQRIALATRLNLVKVSEPSIFRLIDLGRRKYLEKKRKSKRRLVNRVVKKHIEIKSNIDAHDLDIKFNAISRFLVNNYRVSVMVRRLKLTTTIDVYNEFVSAVKNRIAKLIPFFEGPTHTEAGDSVFYLYSVESQSKRLQAKN
ncbi:MAG: Translation initiation factor IF-3 [Candidatus Hodgkinia cicadicola]|nr:MAG: Translation initiation factor IF-3 [Candidatus Hodgkinia cicadicola]